MKRFAIYDHDQDKMLPSTYYSYEEALDDLDPRMNNCMVVAFEDDEDDETEDECDLIRRIIVGE